jgi:hypothetical protein
VLACTMTSSWETAAQEASATPEAPARISVSVPRAADGQMLLNIVVKGFRKPATGNIGGVVRLQAPGGGNAVEVGRFSIFPAQSFTAANADQEQRYQFNVTSALRQLGLSGGTAEVEVALIDRSNGEVPADARLIIGNVQIATR